MNPSDCGGGAGWRLCVGMLGWQDRAAISEPVKTEDWSASRSGVNHCQNISHLTHSPTKLNLLPASLDTRLSYDPELTIDWIKSSICTIYLLLYSITKMQSVTSWRYIYCIYTGDRCPAATLQPPADRGQHVACQHGQHPPPLSTQTSTDQQRFIAILAASCDSRPTI